MTRRVAISQAEACYLELFRVALSEPDMRRRLEAISTIKLEVQSDLIALKLRSRSADRPWGREDQDILVAIAETESARLGAAREYGVLWQRYKGKNGLGNERKLNIAEQIGKMVLLSIQEKTFIGLHTPGGILEQVREQGAEFEVRGAIDKDSSRETWSAYRGVVHLGIALDYCEEFPRKTTMSLNWLRAFG